jgi:hypothetical protein
MRHKVDKSDAYIPKNRKLDASLVLSPTTRNADEVATYVRSHILWTTPVIRDQKMKFYTTASEQMQSTVDFWESAVNFYQILIVLRYFDLESVN